jgi:dTDP-4-dehydrorhamnose reductase
MRVLVIGAEGQLGTALCDEFADVECHRADLDGADHPVDITDLPGVECLLAELAPTHVFNTAAAHNVPRCEAQPDEAFAVNATGAWNLAVACRAAGARLIHVSTDYVFGLGHTTPYVETDLPAPLSVYGASKLAGEHLARAYCPDTIICRTAALYGPAPCRAKGGQNFVSLMLHLAATRPEVRVVNDEFTTPTSTLALARQMRLLAERGAPGLYHTTCQGQASWHEFAAAVFEETGTQTTLVAVGSQEFQSAVRRPDYSVLENRHAQEQGLDILPPWREALREYLQALGSSVK